jgi:uncharacterized protein YbaR (Trm112 family)
MGLLDPLLAEILVCTVDHADLLQDEPNRLLICTSCGRSYPVDEQGIPNMIVDDEAPTDSGPIGGV